ncbi:MAG: hypothetical protein KDD94_13935 [Calditrichaeota bacterium]|nr:hypothetical protein [Calditrichota bacterium]
MRYLIMLSILISCSDSGIDRETATREIMQLHALQRDFHFNKNAVDFARLLGKNHISVNRGKVTQPSQSDTEKRFAAYFNSVEFVKWDDTAEPIIRFSDDNRMAYTIVQKQVILRYQNDAKQTVEETTDFSWLAVYKLHDDGWKIDAVGSTNRESQEKIIE